jgi:hypothetical protein
MLYAPLSSPMRATCPAHLILLALITITILGEEYKPCSSSLCSFLHPPVTSSLLGPNILLTGEETKEANGPRLASYTSLHHFTYLFRPQLQWPDHSIRHPTNSLATLKHTISDMDS